MTWINIFSPGRHNIPVVRKHLEDKQDNWEILLHNLKWTATDWLGRIQSQNEISFWKHGRNYYRWLKQFFHSFNEWNPREDGIMNGKTLISPLITPVENHHAYNFLSPTAPNNTRWKSTTSHERNIIILSACILHPFSSTHTYTHTEYESASPVLKIRDLRNALPLNYFQHIIQIIVPRKDSQALPHRPPTLHYASLSVCFKKIENIQSGGLGDLNEHQRHASLELPYIFVNSIVRTRSLAYIFTHTQRLSNCLN